MEEPERGFVIGWPEKETLEIVHNAGRDGGLNVAVSWSAGPQMCIYLSGG